MTAGVVFLGHEVPVMFPKKSFLKHGTPKAPGTTSLETTRDYHTTLHPTWFPRLYLFPCTFRQLFR
ncbi:hypothetical protein PHYBLDRAFT_140182 [Phycomyces blakesleeanus NRRL 1555(-)]|uniref:Uncharacterized protein n=1 Tax=Phycomyces blakesleeanus (strain ATCC 8743b / DSM 1359 / FGSC 10004 / NBRC 33097 / NRRL 1555) TaxID=763407 RepID=A0A162YE52_PHYB8|nr:hypothetical protein PHYBLDRAFT_140182 [Phycomyces blakesleeanus NRRL 1555(-)]OAD80175.1 hypothetical protein PHYBLDRAFT_140182 [Phycomyces blakesleeanus NRRL 1555(-)]|eukprot:XP_018298215.1 hypothetical protein PHYBLDRAFT_140182 [Phycomyces blakesleeanus NRRL 1555(-)]